MSIYNRRMEEATRNLTAWCSEHVAEYDSGTLGGEPMELLVWRKPGTGLHLMRFLSMGPRLIVTGDLYEAVYCREAGLRWWAGCDLQYFAEKCQASAHGRSPLEWDPDECLSSAKEAILQRMREDGQRGLWRRFKEEDGPDSVYTEWDWFRFLDNHGDEFFGEDSWYLSFGKVISFDTAYHLVGLRLALAQLDRQASGALAEVGHG